MALGSCEWSSSADARVLDRLRLHRDSIRGVGDPALFVFARGFHDSLTRGTDRGEVTLVDPAELFA